MKKILIVDDEKPISDIIKFNMTREGYEVVTAFDGREALDIFEAEFPDIVILDLMLPEIDGLEVARTIRKTSNVPILMLSAKDSVNTFLTALRTQDLVITGNFVDVMWFQSLVDFIQPHSKLSSTV